MTEQSHIKVKGARTHNLKNIDVDIERGKMVVITGLSGSGKSSLAFDTIYAEGQRRYVESLSTYARQFLSLMDKPDVDSIDGLSPAISIEQKAVSHNPRSTVGTTTEIYDYLRLLFARIGTPHCPTHHQPLKAQSVSQMVQSTLSLPKEKAMMLLSPITQNKKGEFISLFKDLRQRGFLRVRVNGEIYQLDQSLPKLDLHKKHDIEVVVDRFKVRSELSTRLAQSFETALLLSDGTAYLMPIAEKDGETIIFSERFACHQCGYSLVELEPRLFSFNSPQGACKSCDGLGHYKKFDEEKLVNFELSLDEGAIYGFSVNQPYSYEKILKIARHYQFETDIPFNKLNSEIQNLILHGIKPKGVSSRSPSFIGVIPYLNRRYVNTDIQTVRESLSRFMRDQICQKCHGSRLNEKALSVKINGTSLDEIVFMPLNQVLDFFQKCKLSKQQQTIAKKIMAEIIARTQFLLNVGLDYLNLARSSETLSGGESQRIRLASQIGSGLTGILYVLDEPSIGLHQRDNRRLLDTLFYLRDLNNTVIVVEHDEEAIINADQVIDIGPLAGVNGGQVIHSGDVNSLRENVHSLTADYLAKRKKIVIPTERTTPQKDYFIHLKGAKGNNLKSVNLDIPLGLFTCITGVSGSGKSTLINKTLYSLIANRINKASHEIADYESVEGINKIDKVVNINQSPIGRTPRSNPATYTGVFTLIRELFVNTQEARIRGYKPGRFSFNVKGGRCEACQGDGMMKVEMHFLPDVYVACDVCKTKRYNRETLQVRYKGKSIADVLEMTVAQSLELFDAYPGIKTKLQTLYDVGLEYIQLGQSAITLSGGEAQRIKLAKELAKRDTGKTLYVLDEPTVGLHFHDVAMLLEVLKKLKGHGNTIVVIEHNLDVIKTADWVIDMGPEGGDKGGEIIAEGTPEQVATIKKSYTGIYLKEILNENRELINLDKVQNN